jgi:hypothetical protein
MAMPVGLISEDTANGVERNEENQPGRDCHSGAASLLRGCQLGISPVAAFPTEPIGMAFTSWAREFVS